MILCLPASCQIFVLASVQPNHNRSFWWIVWFLSHGSKFWTWQYLRPIPWPFHYSKRPTEYRGRRLQTVYSA
jgi:hypothetical protein